jgi:catechol 2,3-dioxygenase-like lactoylglutathione lyase family enzyme
MDLVGLDHYAIAVKDLQRSAGWYCDVLGLHLLHRWTTTWMVGRGNIKVGLFLRPDAEPVTGTALVIQHVAFLVDGDKLADVQDELTRKGVEVQGPEDTGIAYSCFFEDPDGHLLEVTSYHAVESPTPSPATRPADSHAQ